MDSEPLRPFFSYFGSKWRLAPLYPAPRHDVIVEPFAGSAGYALHYPDRQVILIERDPVVAALWRWLIGACAEEILSLPRLIEGDCLDDYDMPSEARTLMGLWIAQARAAPGRVVTARGAIRQRHYRVSDQLKRIRHWSVIEGDYTEAPDLVATWFIDPPYQVAGTSQYRFNSKQIDFARLGVWCRERQGRAIACENAGADWLPFEPLTRQQGLTLRGRAIYSEEVIWLNDRASALPLAA